MKKLIALAMALVLCLALVACGGPDKNPAIDAFNKTNTAFNEVANTINKDPGAYDEAIVNAMNEKADVLAKYKALLEGDEEVAQEKLDEIIKWCGETEKWVTETKANLDSHKVTEPATEPEVTEPEVTEPETEISVDAAIEAYNAASTAYGELTAIMEPNLDAFSEDEINTVNAICDQLTAYGEILDGEEITEEQLAEIIDWCGEALVEINTVIESLTAAE